MMFLEYLYTLPNATSGADDALVQTVSAVPSFTPLLLAFVYLLVFLGGSLRQKARTADPDFPLWSVVASLATLLIALILSVSSGVLALDILSIVFAVTILSGLWLFLQRRQGIV